MQSTFLNSGLYLQETKRRSFGQNATRALNEAQPERFCYALPDHIEISIFGFQIVHLCSSNAVQLPFMKMVLMLMMIMNIGAVVCTLLVTQKDNETSIEQSFRRYYHSLATIADVDLVEQ